MKHLLLISTLAISLHLLPSCAPNNKPVQEEQPLKEETTLKSDSVLQAEANAAEDELRKFLISTEGTYGWETKSDNISLDFFEDGRLHIQGPDGEATMWEGSWKLKGKRLTMERPDLKTTETESANKDGENLVIGTKVYTRYTVNE